MKIAIISEVFYPNIGGMETRHLELGKALIEKGHKVEVYALRLNVSDKVEDAVEGIRIHRITKAFQYFTSAWGLRNYPDVLKFTWDLIKRKKELEHVDAILINEWPVLPAIIAPLCIKNEYILDWCEIYNAPFWKLVYKFMASHHMLHCVMNQKTYEFLTSEFKLPKEKVRFISNGIHPDSYHCNSEKKKNRSVLFLGRLSEHKNVEFLIDAFIFGELDKKGYVLNILGDGKLYAELKDKYDNRNNVFLHGHASDEKKIEFLKTSTLLVLPSKREGFGIVCAEAAAAATPSLTVLYPDNAAVDTIRQYGIGWISDPNIEELSSKIGRYADMDHDEWKDVSRQCVEVAKKSFDINSIAQELLDFIAK